MEKQNKQTHEKNKNYIIKIPQESQNYYSFQTEYYFMKRIDLLYCNTISSEIKCDKNFRNIQVLPSYDSTFLIRYSDQFNCSGFRHYNQHGDLIRSLQFKQSRVRIWKTLSYLQIIILVRRKLKQVFIYWDFKNDISYQLPYQFQQNRIIQKLIIFPLTKLICIFQNIQKKNGQYYTKISYYQYPSLNQFKLVKTYNIVNPFQEKQQIYKFYQLDQYSRFGFIFMNLHKINAYKSLTFHFYNLNGLQLKTQHQFQINQQLFPLRQTKLNNFYEIIPNKQYFLVFLCNGPTQYDSSFIGIKLNFHQKITDICFKINKGWRQISQIILPNRNAIYGTQMKERISDIFFYDLEYNKIIFGNPDEKIFRFFKINYFAHDPTKFISWTIYQRQQNENLFRVMIRIHQIQSNYKINIMAFLIVEHFIEIDDDLLKETLNILGFI